MQSNWPFQLICLTLFGSAILFSEPAFSSADTTTFATASPIKTFSKRSSADASSTLPQNRAPITQQQLVPEDPTDDTQYFGGAVSLDNDYALVGDRFYGDLNHGNAFLFKFNGSSWINTQRLRPNTGLRSNYSYGTSVSLSGEFAFVGMSGDNFRGGVYIFRASGDQFEEFGFLLPSSINNSDQFGQSLSLSGFRAIIGSLGDSSEGDSAGAVYFFEFNGVNWDQKDKLTASDAVAGDNFGQSVSISGDTAIVGAKSGIYVFERTSGGWSETGKLIPTNGDASIARTGAVALHSDLIVAGSRWDDTMGTDAGAAFVFVKNDGEWSQQSKIIPQDGSAYDQFGVSVAAYGERLAIGAYGDDGNYPNTGSAYIFSFIDGSWDKDTKLSALGASRDDLFGLAVDLDGNRTLVGAPGSFSDSAAFLFTLNARPIANNDSFVADEDFVFSGDLFADNGNGPDSDPDSEPIWIEQIDGKSGFQNAAVTLTSGALVEAATNGTFSYDPNGAFERLGEGQQDTDTFTYHITDGIDSAAATVMITVEGAGDPTIAYDDYRSVLEDSGISNLAVLANDSGDSPVTIIDVTQPSNGTAILEPDSRGLSYEPYPNYCNSTGAPDEFQYTLIGGSTARVEIIVDCINDAPFFEHFGDVEVLEDSQFDSNWAHSIRPGPENESEQTIYFETNVISNPELFVQLPQIDSAGRLSFIPSPNTTGIADIEAVAIDSGGIAHNGVNTSAVVSFQIDVFSGADLAISKTSGSVFTQPGGDISYTIQVSNSGPSDAFGARVVDDPPIRLGDVSWVCVPSAGSTCNSSGVGLINEFVLIPEGSHVTFFLDATLIDSANEPITNEAYIDAPAGIRELAPDNNADSDTNLVALFADGMESEEP